MKKAETIEEILKLSPNADLEGMSAPTLTGVLAGLQMAPKPPANAAAVVEADDGPSEKVENLLLLDEWENKSGGQVFVNRMPVHVEAAKKAGWKKK